MKKSLYSLILTDDVVKEVDSLAKERNTNRSNLINQILAEYVSFTTPEKRINDIFTYIDSLLNANTFNSFIEPYERTMSVKSSLEYKYRPTIKYEVELYKHEHTVIGELKVIFRTQSADLLYRLHDFFELWTKMESIYLKDAFRNCEIRYSFENGKFTRTLAFPFGETYTGEQTAKAISDYIEMFDDIVKGSVSGRYQSVTEIENRYLSYLNNSLII